MHGCAGSEADEEEYDQLSFDETISENCGAKEKKSVMPGERDMGRLEIYISTSSGDMGKPGVYRRAVRIWKSQKNQ